MRLSGESEFDSVGSVGCSYGPGGRWWSMITCSPARIVRVVALKAEAWQQTLVVALVAPCAFLVALDCFYYLGAF